MSKNTATQTGAGSQQPTADPDVNPDEEVVVHRNPRDIALEAMAERQEQTRIDELAEARKNDPDLDAHQARLDAEYKRTSDESRREAGMPESDENLQAEGVISKEPMHQPAPEKSDLPSNLQDDPLADFIQMENGAPMVKAKVNGQERLIPLADAKRQLQIGVAAEVRMQSAAAKEKEIQAREQQLAQREAVARQPQQPTTPAEPDLSEEEVLAEATDIFNTAFSGTEEEAAKKLAKTLMKLRTASPAQPQIDEQKLVQRAAQAAVGTIKGDSRKQDLLKGFSAFKTEYSEIAEDPMLFKMADDMTGEIEREHPDWDMTQVLGEAGKRTRAWVDNLKGKTEDTGDDNPAPQPEDEANRAAAGNTQNRLERKGKLVPLPSGQAGSAVFNEDAGGGANRQQTPQEAFREVRNARGQPV